MENRLERKMQMLNFIMYDDDKHSLEKNKNIIDKCMIINVINLMNIIISLKTY